MNRLTMNAAFVLLLLTAVAMRSPIIEDPSDASQVLATYSPQRVEPVGEETPAGARVRAAQAFLESLSDDLRTQCNLTLDDSERSNWTNVPPGAVEKGARLGDMDAEHLHRACDLLATVLSDQGYAQMRDTLLADDRLLIGGTPRRGFGAENFWLVIFGTPSTTGAWGLQLDGHHIAINLSFDGTRMTMSPSFFGTQPSRYERSGETIRPMAGEVDAAFALVRSLSDEQRAQAVVGDRRGRIFAGPGHDGEVPEVTGLGCASFDDPQRELLSVLIHHYIGHLPSADARARMLSLRAEFDRMSFAWSGPVEEGSDVSYRLQGPSLLIEYACQDLGGDPLNHLHAMYRNPRNEYGAGFANSR